MSLALLRRSTALPVAVEKRSPLELQAWIEALASSFEPEFAKALLAYLEKLYDRVTLEALLAALETGNMAAVLQVLDDVDLGEEGEALEGVVRSMLWGAGLEVARRIRFRPTSVSFRFDRLNPALITWLRSYSLGLIKRLDDQTREAVRDKLVQGMAKGENPLDTARAVKSVVGLLPKQAQYVSNFRAELEAFHRKRTAAGWGLGGKVAKVNGHHVWIADKDGKPKDGILERRLRDKRFDKTLIKALLTGNPLTPEQIDKMVAAYEKAWLQHRARTIARTEALRTTNQGVMLAWQQAIEAGTVPAAQVRRLWLVTKDERTCPICGPIPAMNGKRGVKMGQPFKTPDGPVMIPPLHPNCRCTVFCQVFEPSQLLDEAA